MICLSSGGKCGTFHIGMLHGSLAGDVSHAIYAPFDR